MSSSNISWTDIRRGMGDPLSAQLRGLINKQNMFINSQQQPTTQRARGIGRATNSRLVYQDPFSYAFASQFKNRYFIPPMEPDGKYLTCWIPMKSLGRYIKDLSHFNNHAYLVGLPKMCSGPDDGLYGGRVALEFNHNVNHDDFLYIPHSPKLSVGAALTGISVFARIRVNSVQSSGGIDTTICQKVDDATATSGFALRIGPDGKVKWFPRKSSVTYPHISAAGAINVDEIYDIGCRYKLSDNSTEVHVDGAVEADASTESISYPVDDETDLRIGMGDNGDSGRACVTFYDFRVYYEYLISTTEWGHLFSNKRSITNSEYGLIAAEGITQLEFTPPFTDGYSPSGFSH